MLDDEIERHVKARLDHGGSSLKTYVRQGRKSTVKQKEMPSGDFTVDDVPSPNTSSDTSNEDVEDDTYIPSPWAPTHGKEKGLASTSGSGTRDEDVRAESYGEDSNGDGEEC
jgi:hypothetical protein